MYTTITASSRFKIYAAVALAALLMTMLAVTLAAGQAQATTITNIADSGDDNSIPQQQGESETDTPPRHKTPEACPGDESRRNEKAAAVVDSGHYALFDVWWNPVEKELTNSVCPPEATYTRQQKQDEFGPIPGEYTYTYTRTPSSIDITAEPPTIIHIPSSTRVDLSSSTTYTQTKYPKVWEADGKENRDTNNDGTPDGVGDGIVWVLPACPPDGTPSEVGLCLSFSAALLKQADWVKAGGSANGKIEYLIDHVHQTDIDKQDPRYVLAYDAPAPDDGASTTYEAIWDTSDADSNVMEVAPEAYRRPMWFFTSRGTYEFQVHIKGHPNPNTIRHDGLKRLSPEKSVTSDVREYILHVGAEADLGVTTTVAPQNPSPGNSVTVTITASNAGPDTAEKTKVDVALPDGLTYSSHSTETGTYDNTTGVWAIGELAKDVSKTLTVTATVDAETHGKKLDVEAEISATEPVKITETVKNEQSGQDEEKEVTYHVPVPDPTLGNNKDTGTITVTKIANLNPMFMVVRSVPENSPLDTKVGAPVLVRHRGLNSSLRYTLKGDYDDHFKVLHSDGGAQIRVSAFEGLDYETQRSYDLALEVSDGLDEAGNHDNWAADHTIAVRIEIIDVVDLVLSVSDTDPSFGEAVTWTASLSPPVPAGSTNLNYYWAILKEDGTPDQNWEDHNGTIDPTFTWTANGPHPVDAKVRVFVEYTDSNEIPRRTPIVESDWVYWR